MLPGLAPLRLGLQLHEGLDHHDGGRVGRRLDPTDLAEDRVDLGELTEHLVLDVEDPGRRGDGESG